MDAEEATRVASARFEQWAGIDAPHLPAHLVDAMQVQLARWQHDRFPNSPTGDVHMALGVIEELGEALESRHFAEAKDALGDVMIYCSQICTANRLAVCPVIDLGVWAGGDVTPSPGVVSGRFAHVVLKHAQKIRGLGSASSYRTRLVHAMSLMIRKAIDVCSEFDEGTVLHVDNIFLEIGAQVMKRKKGDVMIPGGAR